MTGSIAIVAGARPNFMKIAPILRELDNYQEVSSLLIHTGQHYDRNLSAVFFEELKIKKPDISLGIGGGSHGDQVGRLIPAIEEILNAGDQQKNGRDFDWVVVVGDVNSTMAGAVAASKLNIPVAHVEAGLRSFDRTMPEEINRLITDSISKLLLCSEPDGMKNLQREGHGTINQFSSVHLVGNVMIDTLMSQLHLAHERPQLDQLNIKCGEYAVVTMHRPSNVDFRETLFSLLEVLQLASKKIPIVFPVHPRTKQRLLEFELWESLESAQNIKLLDPVGYLDFLCLTSQAKVVVTDSGGLQEESTALGVPCLTLRENTERPITVTDGTSTLVGSSAVRLDYYLNQVIDGSYKLGTCPKLWDGKAAQRIAELICTHPRN